MSTAAGDVSAAMETPDTSTQKDPLSYIMPLGFAYYASTRSLSPGLYQILVDRCWRRSGTLLYRPNQRNACCPHYTIRLDSHSYSASRDQRQTLNRFNRFVIGEAYAKEAARAHPRSREEMKRRETTFDLIERVHEAESSKLPPISPRKRGKSSKAKRDDNDSAQPVSTTTQAAVSESADLAKSTEPAHRFEVTLEPDTYTDEKYAVFENYQRIVHKEPPSKISKKGFANFLCNSPIRREMHTDDQGRQRQLGSFHQCYRLDGRLVAIGVLDLLPECVSSVYFLYHESIHTHSPGKLSAMREIALARELNYRWWYSGYYIHGCPKMRYKLDFLPQYVLDPELVASWDLLDKKALETFDKQAYVSFSHERVMAYKRQMDDLRAKGTPHKYDIFAMGEALSFHSGSRTTASTTTSGGNVSMDGGSEQQTAGQTGATANDEDSDEDGNLPLFTSNMPGLPTMNDIENYWLDELPIFTSHQPEMFPIKHLVAWGEGSYIDNESFKNKVAELVAMLGSDLRDRLCVDFRRHSN
ncbi:Arginyl-tRNA--protein transferase 1 [Sporothrix bragantina]|uniref:arginyltransferase n=1 Tax=Sporothrix bragantina TaxID=671064 RepID=A0ABP0BCY2_9PEZI